MENSIKLELKHLAPYLPYGLEFGLTLSKSQFICTGITVHEDGIMAHHKKGSSNVSLDKYYKPILRPMSDIDKVISVGDESIRCSKLFDLTKDENGIWCDSYYADQCESPSAEVPVTDVNWWLFKYHFDVFGLIPAGLAIDINTLSNG